MAAVIVGRHMQSSKNLLSHQQLAHENTEVLPLDGIRLCCRAPDHGVEPNDRNSVAICCRTTLPWSLRVAQINRCDQKRNPGSADRNRAGRKLLISEGTCQYTQECSCCLLSDNKESQVVLTREGLCFAKMHSDKVTEYIPVKEVRLYSVNM